MRYKQSPTTLLAKQTLTTFMQILYAFVCTSNALNNNNNNNFNHMSQSTLQQLTASASNIAMFDASATSSSLGEPIFRLQPQRAINFASSTGAIIGCLASGSPQPNVEWFSGSLADTLSDSANYDSVLRRDNALTNVSNLRVISADGAYLQLLPFKANNYRPDIHSSDYRCVATNDVGEIHSISVSVQAVLDTNTNVNNANDNDDNNSNNEDETSDKSKLNQSSSAALLDEEQSAHAPSLTNAKVSDEFVQLNAHAVFKCKQANSERNTQSAQNSNNQLLSTANWFTSDGLVIKANSLLEASKFVAFRTGELHVARVQSTDLQRSYGCAMRNAVTHARTTSSGNARLVIIGSDDNNYATTANSYLHATSNGATTLHSQPKLVSQDSASVLQALAVQLQQQQHQQAKQATSNAINNAQQLVNDAADEQRVIIACAIRAPKTTNNAQHTNIKLDWLVEPASTRQRVTLAQFARQLQAPLLTLPPNSAANVTAGFSYHSGSKLELAFVVGSTFLAIEWPTVRVSGRYIARATLPTTGELVAESACDTTVIVGRKIELSIKSTTRSSTPFDAHNNLAEQTRQASVVGGGAESGQAAQAPLDYWLGRALSVFSGPTMRRSSRRRRRVVSANAVAAATAADSNINQGLVVRRASAVELPQIVLKRNSNNIDAVNSATAKLKRAINAECWATGSPIDSVRWLVNGQRPPQSEVVVNTLIGVDDDSALNIARPISSLNFAASSYDEGLHVLECFAFNSLGDSARAQLSVYVSGSDIEQVSLEPLSTNLDRKKCLADELFTDLNTLEQQQQQQVDYSTSIDSSTQQLTQARVDDWLLQTQARRLNSVRKFSRAKLATSVVAIEDELLELQCLLRSATSNARVEWRKVQASSKTSSFPKRVDTNNSSITLKQPLASSFQIVELPDARVSLAGQRNELLTIASTSRKFDAATFFCSLNDADVNVNSNNNNNNNNELDSSTNNIQDTDNSATGRLQQNSISSHQSSSQSSAAFQQLFNCSHSLLTSKQTAVSSTLSLLEGEHQIQQQQQQRQHNAAKLSSINIRIVAKPKISAFEFARNLEEGQRAIVVCTLIAGEPPVKLTWFKDNQLFLGSTIYDNDNNNNEDDNNYASESRSLVSIDSTNNFSSTLTFNSIRALDSALYTCVASNSFASTNHSSRLQVNVAPYFVGAPPGDTRATLGSTISLDCRARGFPEPQIRWKKLTTISTAAASSEESSRVLEFKTLLSSPHLQVLENGSLLIKQVELADAGRYACQVSNGVGSSLSHALELSVASPARFNVQLETISIKRNTRVKFDCAPRGDYPITIEWKKDDNLLVSQASTTASSTIGADEQQQLLFGKYSEIAQFGNGQELETQLYLTRNNFNASSSKKPINDKNNNNKQQTYKTSSQLVVHSADRTDSGNFVCTASNAHGSDQLTYRLLVQQEPDAPVSLRALLVQSNAVKIGWLADFDGNSPIAHFIIEHRKLNHAASRDGDVSATPTWTQLVVGAQRDTSISISSANIIEQASQQSSINAQDSVSSGKQHALTSAHAYSVLIRGLSPKSAYQIRVAAVNSIGQSAFSTPPLMLTTAEDAPTFRPLDLRALPTSSTNVRLTWRGPDTLDEAAPVRGYQVSRRKLSTVLTSSNHQFTLVSSISASNASSQPTLLSQQTSNDGSSAQQINVARNYELIVTNLEKDTKYEFRVTAFNSIGFGPNAEIVSQTLKFNRPAQPAVKLVSARRTSLELRWSVVGDEPLLGFSIFYKSEFDDWQEVQVGSIFHYVIDNLRCGNKYQLYVNAFNSVGRSDPSDVLLARTEGFAPLAPERAKFVSSNISEALLNLAAWQSGSCPILSFTIQYKRLHDANWFVLTDRQQQQQQLQQQQQTAYLPPAAGDLSSNGNLPQSPLVVSNLMPATWYKLLVTALNEAGSTSAEYVFSTLTKTGEQVPLDALASSMSRFASNNNGQGGAAMLLASLANSLGIYNSTNDFSSNATSSALALLLLAAIFSLTTVVCIVSIRSVYATQQSTTNSNDESTPSSTSLSSAGSSSQFAANIMKKRKQLFQRANSTSPNLTALASFSTSTANANLLTSTTSNDQCNGSHLFGFSSANQYRSLKHQSNISSNNIDASFQPNYTNNKTIINNENIVDCRSQAQLIDSILNSTLQSSNNSVINSSNGRTTTNIVQNSQRPYTCQTLKFTPSTTNEHVQHKNAYCSNTLKFAPKVSSQQLDSNTSQNLPTYFNTEQQHHFIKQHKNKYNDDCSIAQTTNSVRLSSTGQHSSSMSTQSTGCMDGSSSISANSPLINYNSFVGDNLNNNNYTSSNYCDSNRQYQLESYTSDIEDQNLKNDIINQLAKEANFNCNDLSCTLSALNQSTNLSASNNLYAAKQDHQDQTFSIQNSFQSSSGLLLKQQQGKSSEFNQNQTQNSAIMPATNFEGLFINEQNSNDTADNSPYQRLDKFRNFSTTPTRCSIDNSLSLIHQTESSNNSNINNNNTSNSIQNFGYSNFNC